ncbi:MAG: PRC-barrel domain containing protein [Ilumatobacteraceae bacterium]
MRLSLRRFGHAAAMSMWDYRDEVAMSDVGIVGYEVEASDGRIGKIDESSADAGSAYVVVDTGLWIFGKKRLIPAGVIERVDDDAERVFIGMIKDQVKDAPDFEEDHRSRRDDYANYYQPYGRADEVT